MPGRVLLVGPPNVGKSLLFQRLTGRYAEVSNFPGTTVELTEAIWGKVRLVDTPGIYGLAGGTEEERVTGEMLAGADVAIVVTGVLTLERDLYLALQVAATGIPLLLVVNQMDEARRRGLQPELAALRAALGVPVVGTVAVRDEGTKGIGEVLPQAAPGGCGLTAFGLGRSLGDVRSVLEGRFGEEKRAVVQDHFHRGAEALAALVLGGREGSGRRRKAPPPASGLWLLKPFPGFLVLLAILAAIYAFLGVVMAREVLGFLEKTVLGEFYTPLMEGLCRAFFPQGGFWYAVLAGENGLLTVTAAYLLIVLLPLVAAFYFCLGLLEDTGYLPRLVVLLDRTLGSFGLNGKAVIPLILGLGCGTAATVGARTLDSPRERIAVTFLLALVVPCSAQMAVIFGLLAHLGLGYLALYFGLLAIVFGGAGLLGGTLLGAGEELAIDLPPLRLPSLGNILRKTFSRAVFFGKEAFPYFFYGGVAMAILEQGRVLSRVENWLRPLTVGWLGLPPAAAKAFLLGMVRRDFGAAGLYQLTLSPGQTLTAAFTITLFVPCLPALLVILKERGKVVGVAIWLVTMLAAFSLGGVVARLVGAV